MKNFQEAEKLTQEDKMKLWHDGKRGFNFKTATPEKLRTNYKICKKLGFKAECKLLSDELKKRGLKIAGKDLDSVKESRSFREGTLTAEDIIEDKALVNSFVKDVRRYYNKIRNKAEDRIGLQASVREYIRNHIDWVLPKTTEFTSSDEYDRAAYLLDEIVEEKLYESQNLRRKSLKEGSLYSAESLAEKIDEIATACGDFYFDTYCGGVNAQDPDEIRDELDDYIADVLRSGEFILPTKAFDNEAEWNKFVRAATDAAWECIYFNYDTAKEQVAMNEEYEEEEFNESRRFRRKSLHERGMTEYGVSHADEIYRDNYEREQEKSGDKYIVRPKTQATNRYLTGEFGVRDSYALSFGTLRDLVRTCVNSNDDIELYDTKGDYYFKDEGRIYDVLGFVNDSLNESLVNKFLNQKKMKEYRVDLNGRKEDHISSRKLEDFLKTKGCDFNVVGDGIYEVYIDSKDRYYVEIFTKSGLGSNIYEMRCIRSDAGVTQDLMMKWKGYSFDEFVTDLKDAYNAYGDCPLR